MLNFDCDFLHVLYHKRRYDAQFVNWDEVSHIFPLCDAPSLFYYGLRQHSLAKKFILTKYMLHPCLKTCTWFYKCNYELGLQSLESIILFYKIKFLISESLSWVQEIYQNQHMSWFIDADINIPNKNYLFYEKFFF